jgi:hypothetical protein
LTNWRIHREFLWRVGLDLKQMDRVELIIFLLYWFDFCLCFPTSYLCFPFFVKLPRPRRHFEYFQPSFFPGVWPWRWKKTKPHEKAMHISLTWILLYWIDFCLRWNTSTSRCSILYMYVLYVYMTLWIFSSLLFFRSMLMEIKKKTPTHEKPMHISLK